MTDPDIDDRGLLELEQRLAASRPIPSPAFRGALRRHLIETQGRMASPVQPRLAVAAYALGGVGLLAIVAVGLAGAGPFAP